MRFVNAGYLIGTGYSTYVWIFILGNLPLPVILYLNWRVTRRFLRVRELSKQHPLKRPRGFLIGWWMSNFAAIFVLIPVITERRLFVQDFRWLASYAVAATLTISGLILMNGALGEELAQLTRRGGGQTPPAPVDSQASDTL